LKPVSPSTADPGDHTMLTHALLAITDHRKRMIVMSILMFASMC
jgi:hypothetical protein